MVIFDEEMLFWLYVFNFLNYVHDISYCLADINDVGDYVCRFNVDNYYIKEQHATLSCMWGYFKSQSYGCPAPGSISKT